MKNKNYLSIILPRGRGTVIPIESGLIIIQELIMYFVYVLYSNRHDKYYIGQTNNLERRLGQHNSGKSRATKHYLPWAIFFQKELKTRVEAMQFEKYLKSLKNKNYLSIILSRGRGTVTSGGS